LEGVGWNAQNTPQGLRHSPRATVLDSETIFGISPDNDQLFLFDWEGRKKQTLQTPLFGTQFFPIGDFIYQPGSCLARIRRDLSGEVENASHVITSQFVEAIQVENKL